MSSALQRLHEHNAWANARVLASYCGAAPESLAAGGGDQLLRRLRHMLGVEAAFSAAMAGLAVPDEVPRTIEGLEASASAAGAALIALAGADESRLRLKFRIPWFDPEFEVQDGLMQVLSHSGQHRAEIAMELARAGVDAGNLDYILWIQGKA